MRKSRVLLALLLVGVMASSALSVPISYISATTVPTEFSPVGGDFDLGTLTLSGVRPLVVHGHDGSQTVIQNVTFSLTMSLKQDNSSGGIVDGLFQGGVITLTDSSNTTLLWGTITSAGLKEQANDVVVLVGAGTIQGITGSLGPDFGPAGTLYDLIFTSQPMVLNDLTQSFSGFSDITIAPVPEPVTLTILGLGLAGLAAYRRRR